MGISPMGNIWLYMPYGWPPAAIMPGCACIMGMKGRCGGPLETTSGPSGFWYCAEPCRLLGYLPSWGIDSLLPKCPSLGPVPDPGPGPEPSNEWRRPGPELSKE